MEVGNSLEAILGGVEFHKGHVLLVGVAQDLDRLHLPELAEYLVEHVLLADILLEGTHVQSLRRGVDRQRPIGSKPAFNTEYLSKDLS